MNNQGGKSRGVRAWNTQKIQLIDLEKKWISESVSNTSTGTAFTKFMIMNYWVICFGEVLTLILLHVTLVLLTTHRPLTTLILDRSRVQSLCHITPQNVNVFREKMCFLIDFINNILHKSLRNMWEKRKDDRSLCYRRNTTE